MCALGVMSAMSGLSYVSVQYPQHNVIDGLLAMQTSGALCDEFPMFAGHMSYLCRSHAESTIHAGGANRGYLYRTYTVRAIYTLRAVCKV